MEFRKIFILFIWCYQTNICESVCLDYLACYDQLSMNYQPGVIEIYFEDLDVRSANSCGVLCEERNPEAPLVMAKMIPMNERLVCGCGDRELLGNYSGVLNDDLFCSQCPDGDLKCGGLMSVAEENPLVSVDGVSVYQRVIGDEECDDASYIVPSIVVPTQSVDTTTISPTSPVTASPTSLKNLDHLGCYDDNNINITLMKYNDVGWTDTTIADCLYVCENLASNYRLILKVLNDSHIYCGCGFEDCLGQPMKEHDCQGRVNENQCQFECPLGIYSAYSRATAGVPLSLNSMVSLVLVALLAHRSWIKDGN